MTDSRALQLAILDTKLSEFVAECDSRALGAPDVQVKFSTPGLDMYFPLSVGGTFDPAAAGPPGPGV